MAPSGEHDRAFQRAMAAILAQAGIPLDQGAPFGRERSAYSSTFVSEIVTCRTLGGIALKLHCKHGVADNGAHGHRRGIAYEARVYQVLLAIGRQTTARYYGTWSDPETGETWLALEHLVDTFRVSKAGGNAMRAAARWIADFHREHAGPARDSIHRYDEPYYRQWSVRTCEMLGRRVPAWLAALRDRFDSVSGLLLAAPQTIIHGEYYPANILTRAAAVYPVDWESAAHAAGEIDLAALTDNWDDATANECEREYAATRWPGGSAHDFERTLAAARVYLHLRWIGGADPGARRRLDALRAEAERLGVI